MRLEFAGVKPSDASLSALATISRSGSREMISSIHRPGGVADSGERARHIGERHRALPDWIVTIDLPPGIRQVHASSPCNRM
jgi:hypothetical protein